MGQIAEPIFIQIGRKRYQVASFEQASQMYSAARDEALKTMVGSASQIPEGKIVTANGKKVARISYNGRVWPPEPWHSGMQPLV